MLKKQGVIYAYTTPAYRRTKWSGGRSGRGLIKVGFTARDPHQRIREQIGASSPEKVPYSLLVTAPARTRKGKAFTDKDVHRELKALGVRNVHNEWFEARPEDVRRALDRLGGRADRKLHRAPAKRRKRRPRPSRRRKSSWSSWIVCGLIALMFAAAYQPEGFSRTITSLSSNLLPP